MEAIIFLFEAFFGGLLVFFTEELIQSAKYSFSTLAFSLTVGLLSLVLTRRSGKHLSLIATGAIVGACTAIFRVTIVYGGFVTSLADVDCFASLNLGIHTYFLFALSGAFAGFILTLSKKQSRWIHVTGIMGIASGVLYHLKIAQGWWSAQLLVAVPLFVGEFLAPTFFLIGLIWLVKVYILAFRIGYLRLGKETRDPIAKGTDSGTRCNNKPWPSSKKPEADTDRKVLRDWDNLPSLAMTPVYEPFSYQELVRYVFTQAPDKQLICVVPYGWGTTQGQAFRDIQLLYEFADDQKLVLMCIVGPLSSDVQIILRAAFMRESVSQVKATTFRELISKLTDLAKKHGLKTKIVK